MIKRYIAEKEMLIKDFLLEKGFTENISKELKNGNGQILVNDQCVENWYQIKPNDLVEIVLPTSNQGENIISTKHDFEILYEDSYILIINKENNLASIPTRNHYANSLSNYVMSYYKRKGIRANIHCIGRLDYATSGIIMFAKNPYIADVIKKQQIDKKYILEVEAIIKTKIANLFAEKYGINDYLNINNFDLKENGSNLKYIKKLINEIKYEIEKGTGKHDAISHYANKYGFVPPCVVTKVLSLGTISRFYGLMKQQDRQKISKQFNINDRMLKNILGNLTSVRNISAHDDRLYTYRSTFYIRLDKTKKSPDKVLHTNMYIIIKSLELLLENDQAIEMKSLITKELNTLNDSLTSITIDEVLRVMGFDKEYYIV